MIQVRSVVHFRVSCRGLAFLAALSFSTSGFEVKGIKAAAAIWITGALGLAIATSYWWLGITVGLITAAVMFVADSFPDEVREEKQETPVPSRTRRSERRGITTQPDLRRRLCHSADENRCRIGFMKEICAGGHVFSIKIAGGHNHPKFGPFPLRD